MRKHAIVGSRVGVDKDVVERRVQQLYQQWGRVWILVSGGAHGTCQWAEDAALERGIPVVSFRVADITHPDPEFVVEEWRLHRGRGEVIRHEPTWATWASAAGYKAMLIAERADTADAFHAKDSRGTAYEIECFAVEGVPCEVFVP